MICLQSLKEPIHPPLKFEVVHVALGQKKLLLN